MPSAACPVAVSPPEIGIGKSVPKNHLPISLFASFSDKGASVFKEVTLLTLVAPPQK